jgi:hypothetical protein
MEAATYNDEPVWESKKIDRADFSNPTNPTVVDNVGLAQPFVS